MSCNRLWNKVLPSDRDAKNGAICWRLLVYANYEAGEIWALDLGSLLSSNQGVKEVCVGRVAQSV